MDAKRYTPKDDAEPSGRVYIDSGKIIWENQSERIGEIVISDIRLIGEYTTAEGPVLDDWFIVFFMSKDDCRQVSAYAKGIMDVLDQVGKSVGGQVLPGLAASAEWATRLIWPQEVEGKPMWNMEELKPETFGEKVKAFLGLGHPARAVLSDAAATVLTRSSRPTASH